MSGQRGDKKLVEWRWPIPVAPACTRILSHSLSFPLSFLWYKFKEAYAGSRCFLSGKGTSLTLDILATALLLSEAGHVQLVHLHQKGWGMGYLWLGCQPVNNHFVNYYFAPLNTSFIHQHTVQHWTLKDLWSTVIWQSNYVLRDKHRETYVSFTNMMTAFSAFGMEAKSPRSSFD